MSITRIGATKQYADNWGLAFGKKKPGSKKRAGTKTRAAAKKKSSGRKRR